MNRRWLARAAVVGVVAALGPFRAAAQGTSVPLAEGSGVQPLFVVDSGAAWSAKWFTPNRCTAALTAADMRSKSVYLDARMAPQTDATLTSQADLIASDVASVLRTQLGGSDSAAPDIGQKIKWYSIPAELILVAREDGSMTWRGTSLSGDAGAVALLSTAMDSARRHGSAVMLWPEGFAADSIVLRLSLLPKLFAPQPSPPAATGTRMRFLVFTMLAPLETPALPKGDLNIKYPTYNEQHRVTGQTITQFVVDTNGKAVMSTFRDVWPANKPRLSGALEGYYADFIRAVREGVAAETFSPAHTGSCITPQVVQLPVNFAAPDGHRP
jgi:hypothetical protein